ncbi:MAG: hypothetical protein JST80_02505 [Bdellovibrionales bacterium]|nr:hypothetical protein [Bdellovibrionales bacterium]
MKFLAVLALVFGATGCGIWGEAPPAPKNITLTSVPLPPFAEIFSDDEAVATQTLATWSRSIRDTFNQLEGEKKDFLSTAEISTLVRKGFVKISKDSELDVRRVRGVLRILGYKDGISKQNVENLMTWFEKNRVQARSFYNIFIATDTGHNLFSARDMVNLLDFFGGFVSLGGSDSITASEMKDLMDPWIPESYPHAKRALESGFEFGISFFSSFCGDRVETTRWNGKKIGTCMQDLVAHFTSSAPVFDFIFGNLNPIQSRKELRAANDRFVASVESWMKGHNHPLFPTTRVAKFADKLEIPAPYAFFKLTEWIPKLNSDSTIDAFSPTFFIDLAKIANTWINTFTSVTDKEICGGGAGTSLTSKWRDCEFKGEYGPVEKLYNDEYATLIRSKNLGFVYKISLYDQVAQFLMSKFDAEGSGLAQSSIKEMITLAIRLVDSNAFLYNVVSRIQERVYDPSTAEGSLQNIHRQGLAELAALASDLIPERGKNRRGLLKKLQTQIYDPSNRLSYGLDQLGITAFLYIYDLMTSLRADYLQTYDLPVKTEGPLLYVKRRKIVENMPRMLYDHFPHIYNECLAWGFERTCGILFTEVLPSPLQGRDDLETYEMDMMTLTAILLESMVNRCDRNGNDIIGRKFFGLDGYNEKACVISVATSLGKRLMAANIVEQDEHTEFLLNLVKLPFIKWVAKVAITRGTMKGPGMIIRALPPISLFSGAATLGSIISLAAEVMDSDKTKAIDQGVVGHHEDAGDELIYMNELTDHYLPSHENAVRTSEKFR